jgi:hypothetical protein
MHVLQGCSGREAESSNVARCLRMCAAAAAYLHGTHPLRPVAKRNGVLAWAPCRLHCICMHMVLSAS